MIGSKAMSLKIEKKNTTEVVRPTTIVPLLTDEK